MSNSEQISDFFRKMADGSLINSIGYCTDGQKASPMSRPEADRAPERALKVNDFGVGLPPLAHG
jgi:hypothetical protein